MNGTAQLWFWSCVAGIAGFITCRYKPWLALFWLPVTVAVPFLYAMGNHAPEVEVPSTGSFAAVSAAVAILVADLVGLQLGGFKVVRYTLYDRFSQPNDKGPNADHP